MHILHVTKYFEAINLDGIFRVDNLTCLKFRWSGDQILKGWESRLGTLDLMKESIMVLLKDAWSVLKHWHVAGTQDERERSQDDYLGCWYSRPQMRSWVPGPGWKQQFGEETNWRITVEMETVGLKRPQGKSQRGPFLSQGNLSSEELY